MHGRRRPAPGCGPARLGGKTVRSRRADRLEGPVQRIGQPGVPRSGPPRRIAPLAPVPPRRIFNRVLSVRRRETTASVIWKVGAPSNEKRPAGPGGGRRISTDSSSRAPTAFAQLHPGRGSNSRCTSSQPRAGSANRPPAPREMMSIKRQAVPRRRGSVPTSRQQHHPGTLPRSRGRTAATIAPPQRRGG